MDFLRDELGLQDMQACWQAAQRHTHLLQAFAACMALTALFMYLLFRLASNHWCFTCFENTSVLHTLALAEFVHCCMLARHAVCTQVLL